MNLLITGGTGSLGRALTSYYLESPRTERIVIFSRDEYKQAEMAGEFTGSQLRFFLGDVRDRDRLRRAMFDVTHVVHAAALKRVDAVSYNPSEVVKTNVQGTMNVVDAAIDQGVAKVLVVSSDKAVNPQNIYGASKFLAEQYAVDANSYGRPQGTLISAVRYGNVLGSRGSVIHLFKAMAKNGGKIKVTDPRATRFLITLRQACELIDRAFKTMRGGEIYVPRLPTVSIVDLARAVAPGKEIEFIGLRPGGEKLHEVLLNDEEISRASVDYDYVVGGLTKPHLPANFRYASDDENRRLGPDEIKSLLQAEGYL